MSTYTILYVYEVDWTGEVWTSRQPLRPRRFQVPTASVCEFWNQFAKRLWVFFGKQEFRIVSRLLERGNKTFTKRVGEELQPMLQHGLAATCCDSLSEANWDAFWGDAWQRSAHDLWLVPAENVTDPGRTQRISMDFVASGISLTGKTR